MSTRLRRSLLAVAAIAALAGCDLDRLPQSPNAISPGANRFHEDPMTGDETRDHQLDRKDYVQADPL